MPWSTDRSTRPTRPRLAVWQGDLAIAGVALRLLDGNRQVAAELAHRLVERCAASFTYGPIVGRRSRRAHKQVIFCVASATSAAQRARHSALNFRRVSLQSYE